MAGMENNDYVIMQRLATVLDACQNLHGAPIGAEARARIFNAVESPTPENWQDARGVLISPFTTLWGAVSSAGLITLGAAETPSGAQVLNAIEVTVGLTEAAR